MLARDPICRACSRAPATVADHVTPLRAGGGWELANGQGLCRACHNAKTAGERGGRGGGISATGGFVTGARTRRGGRKMKREKGAG
ncbi:MAG TPA: HNH endonuclease signature motif containing protein [Thermoanaerobaculia bacterium]|nr:HNH endonuclease signature motif containing protein [Thermoanaerobaculia bacterium]